MWGTFLGLLIISLRSCPFGRKYDRWLPLEVEDKKAGHFPLKSTAAKSLTGCSGFSFLAFILIYGWTKSEQVPKYARLTIQHQHFSTIAIDFRTFWRLHRHECEWNLKTRVWFDDVQAATLLRTSMSVNHHLHATYLLKHSVDLVAPLATKSLMLEFCLAHPNSTRMLFPEGDVVTMQSSSTHKEMDRWCVHSGRRRSSVQTANPLGLYYPAEAMTSHRHSAFMEHLGVFEDVTHSLRYSYY